MTASWVEIAMDDLQELRDAVGRGAAKWTDDDVVMRLVFDLVAGVVGLSEEMRSEHEEALKVWREVQQPVARARGEGSSAPEGGGGLDRPAEVRQEAVPADGDGGTPPLGLTSLQRDLLKRIGALWRGDWTGHVFDGRDGQRWIETTLGVDMIALAELDGELQKCETEYR